MMPVLFTKRCVPGLLALALAVPGAAYPYSLQQLLCMPLEGLLQLEIGPRPNPPGGAVGVSAVVCLVQGGGRHGA
jgi:hypothetical protein